MPQSLSLMVLAMLMLILNGGRWARAASQGDWGSPVGDMLGVVLIFYLASAAIFFVARSVMRQPDARFANSRANYAGLAVAGFIVVSQSDLGRATAQVPNADDVLCHKSTGQPAIEACGRLIASKRFSGHELAVLLNDRGLLFYRNGDAERAVADYDAALAADPGLGTAWYNRGLARTKLSQLDRAIEDFGQAGKLVPDRAVIWHSRGVARFMMSAFAPAIEDFDRAIGLDPRMALAWGYRGAARLQLGDLKTGAADLSQAMRLDPKNVAFAALLKNAEAELQKR
ncbi:MAG: tetratricopeptide repeat protein [Bosea sp.]|uniref:tetratricopeptide repeat protein n=1 Tax=Bosea sp. (in: a-proteobacteria) TaxID=1871050 RepID=UPI00239943EA|nr:tetratricopeptide repeat protein [Bosea sp. (in: a-proteobacteria)]MCP4733458.1 tetratricopeptide repeat protein [Bosea sp. (in: a-proteobacteria)]